MPGHEGAVPGSRYRRWHVPWVGRTRAVAPCLLCEVLAVILVLRSSVALALALAWLLLRDCGSLGLASFYRVCGGGAGLVLPGPARLGGSLLQSWCLVLGPAASSVAFRPSSSLGSVRRLVFWVPSPLPRNLSFRIRLRLIPSLPRAPCIFLPGLCRKRGWECWSGSSSTSLRAS